MSSYFIFIELTALKGIFKKCRNGMTLNDSFYRSEIQKFAEDNGYVEGITHTLKSHTHYLLSHIIIRNSCIASY